MINVLTIISVESSFYLPVDSLSLLRHCDESEYCCDDGLLHFYFVFIAFSIASFITSRAPSPKPAKEIIFSLLGE